VITATMRIAYAQVDSFLSILEQKYIDMVPRNIRYFFKQEMDTTYDKPITTDVPIKNQNLTDEALALIAYLNLNYWCQDAEEKEELKKRYIENEERYNEELKNHQHGADDIFKSKEQVDNVEKDDTNDIHSQVIYGEPIYEEENEMVVYKKENIFKTIWNKIKSKFIK